MEVTKENLEMAFDHLKSQWLYYWKKKKENPKWIFKPPLEFQEGDMVYVQLDVGFPHEMCFGHWCYVVRDLRDKILVIPSTSVKDGCPCKYEMDINVTLDGRKMKSRLNFSETRVIDKMRIDCRKSKMKAECSLVFIKYKLKEFIGG